MIKYVELSRTEYFSREVEATSDEDAVNQVLQLAPGNPADWSIELVQDASHRETATPEPGAITFTEQV